jgi:hypothetical protein
MIFTVEADAQDMCDRMHLYLKDAIVGYRADCFATPEKHTVDAEWKISWNDHKVESAKQGLIDNVWTAGEYASIVTSLDPSWTPVDV